MTLRFGTPPARTTRCQCEPLETRVLLATSAGALDTSFGHGGIADVPPPGADVGDGASIEVVDQALQPDGKIVAGLTFGAHDVEDFQVMRLNVNGTLDMTFGDHGFTPVLTFNPASFFQQLKGIAVLPNGQILLAGGSPESEVNALSEMQFLRLSSNGTVVAHWSFDGNGYWNNSVVNAIAVQPNGMVVAAGAISRSNGDGGVIAGGDGAIRFNPLTFQLDSSFGTGGVSFVPGIGGVVSVALQGDRILLADAASVIRLLPDGSLDPSFGHNGVASIGDNVEPFIQRMAVQRDGSIIVAGTFGNLTVAHFSANGAFDQSFANGTGFAQVDETVTFLDMGLALQADGKIVLCMNLNDSKFDMFRLNLSGNLDTGFGPSGNGKESIAIPGLTQFGGAETILIDNTGRILVGGEGGGVGIGDADIVRLLPGPSTATAAISGNIFNDVVGGGVKKTGDPSLSGWTVALDLQVNGGWQPLETTETDSSGSYSFPDLAAGRYRVRELQPSGWRSSLNTSATQSVTVAVARHIGNVNFANTQRVVIRGGVFADSNGNGKQDSGELGLAGWRVYVDLNNDGRFDAGDRDILTDSSGNFTIASLDAGTYTIRIVPKVGYHLVAPVSGSYKLTLGAGQVLATRLTFAVATTV